MGNAKTSLRAGQLVYGSLNLANLPPGNNIDARYEIKEKLGQGSCSVTEQSGPI